MTVRLNLRSGFLFDALPGWAPVLALPLPERKRAFGDRAVRERLAAGASSEGAGALRVMANWPAIRVDETFTPGMERYVGRTLGELASERAAEPFDVLCDLAIQDDLKTSFAPFIPGDDEASWRFRATVWDDPRVCIGASDAGAHLDMIDSFTLPVAFLGRAVRDYQLLSLESAVQKLTDAPARLYGFKRRGRLEPGWCADVVVFDADAIGHGPVHSRYDLPAGARRLYAEAQGVDHVLVNGVEIVRRGKRTDALPGRVLRSGRDTETVPIAASRAP
jgi:N-acyl-D-aspartate/D-glutamate deacylase